MNHLYFLQKYFLVSSHNNNVILKQRAGVYNQKVKGLPPNITYTPGTYYKKTVKEVSNNTPYSMILLKPVVEKLILLLLQAKMFDHYTSTMLTK